MQWGAPCVLPEMARGNLPILRDGLTLVSHGAPPAGPEALAFGGFSRFLPGTIVVSMAGDGHGRRRPEAELVLYTLPRNPYDPPCSAIPLSLGQEKLPGAIRACQPGLRHGPGVTSRFAFGGCSARVSRPPPTPFRGPGRTAGLPPGPGLETSGRRSGKVSPGAPGLPQLGSGSRQSLEFVPSLFLRGSNRIGLSPCDLGHPA
jgi:hypothetical protein